METDWPPRKSVTLPITPTIPPVLANVPIPTGPHTYREPVKTWIGNVKTGITEQEAFEKLRHYATPFQGRVLIDQTGHITKIPVFGSVTHVVDPERLTIVNTTMPGHILHPGNVHRSIVREGDDLYVVTRGYGIGALPEANEILAPSLWKGVDEDIRRILNPPAPPAPPPPPPPPPDLSTLSTFEGFNPPGVDSFGRYRE